jgi:transmembrane sensor
LYAIRTETGETEKQMVLAESAAIAWTNMANTSDVVQTYDLPDGSNVTLQPNSSLKFSALFNASIREVQLEGEGFFDVIRNKDKPFIVYANDITTRVLGTSFTVRSFSEDKQVTVVVKTGKVSVLTRSSAIPSVTEETILTPNQEIVYNRAEKIVERRIVETPEPIVSEEQIDRMRFEEAPLNEIVEAIERVYGVNIVYDETKFATCILTTSISGRGLFNRMDIITTAIGATYELKEDRIVIRGAGCNHHKRNQPN